MTNFTFPDYPNQWYNRDDHKLFELEVEEMKKQFPDADFGFLKSSGNMYWVVYLKANAEASAVKKWRFMLLYNKDYGSRECQKSHDGIYVRLVKPSYDELKQRMQDAGIQHKSIPHTYWNKEYGTLVSVGEPEPQTDRLHSAAYYALQMGRWIEGIEAELKKADAPDDR